MATFTVLAVAAGLAVGRAEEPKMPTPAKEHAWLKQLEGEWVCGSEVVMAPSQKPIKYKGTESVRALGGFWTVGEMKWDFVGTPASGVMTLGYDAAKKKYVGTWVCSMDGHLWHYEGTLDAAGKVLTLNTEGPDMLNPGKTAKMKDVIELKGPDHKVLTSHMQGPDGKWTLFMTVTAKRKK